MAHTYNASTQEAKVEDCWEAWSQSQLHSKFQASRSHIMRPVSEASTTHEDSASWVSQPSPLNLHFLYPTLGIKFHLNLDAGTEILTKSDATHSFIDIYQGFSYKLQFHTDPFTLWKAF